MRLPFILFMNWYLFTCLFVCVPNEKKNHLTCCAITVEWCFHAALIFLYIALPSIVHSPTTFKTSTIHPKILFGLALLNNRAHEKCARPIHNKKKTTYDAVVYRKGKRRVTRMVVVIVLVFAICWLPIQVNICWLTLRCLHFRYLVLIRKQIKLWLHSFVASLEFKAAIKAIDWIDVVYYFFCFQKIFLIFYVIFSVLSQWLNEIWDKLSR